MTLLWDDLALRWPSFEMTSLWDDLILRWPRAIYWSNSPAIIIRIILDAPYWWAMSLCVKQWGRILGNAEFICKPMCPPTWWAWHSRRVGCVCKGSILLLLFLLCKVHSIKSFVVVPASTEIPYSYLAVIGCREEEKFTGLWMKLNNTAKTNKQTKTNYQTDNIISISWLQTTEGCVFHYRGFPLTSKTKSSSLSSL